MTAAASLAGAPVPAVRPLLAELTRAHLLAESHPGRYTCHDLLRNYATELTRSHDSHPDRQAALGRLLDYYLHTAATAAALLNPGREPVTLTPPSPVVASEPLADREQALAWFTTEHQTLVSAIHHAARAGFDTHTWQIAWSVANYLDRQGRWHDYAATQYAALDATQRLEDRAAQALSHYALGLANSRLGRPDDAYFHHDRALELCRELDDQVGQARAHHGLSLVFEQRGSYLSALRHAEQALELCRSTGHWAGLARTLNTVGWYHALLGDYKSAITYCEQALALHRELADRNGEADTWDSLGHAHRQLGHHRQAITCYQHAVARFRELGNRYQEATTLTNLGEAHLAAGDSTVASARWRQALCILDDLKHPDAEQLRERLHQ
jgi:tetratricopeptide (TPR) repeat protein